MKKEQRVKLSKLMGIMLLAIAMLAFTGCGVTKKDEKPIRLENTQASDGTDNTLEESATDESSVDEDVVEEYYGELVEGDIAPEFTAPLADGSTSTLSEQSGKVVLLNFWATWCGPCVGEMPAFQQLYEEYGEQISILAVNCMEDVGTVNAFIEDTGYTFPIAYDVEGDVLMKYPSSGIPYTLLIGTDGVIKKIYVGAVDAETQYQVYKSAIEAVLSE